jgi:hypothetical protein
MLFGYLHVGIPLRQGVEAGGQRSEGQCQGGMRPGYRADALELEVYRRWQISRVPDDGSFLQILHHDSGVSSNSGLPSLI